MKKLLLLFLLSGSIYSQEQVFNVQWYCVDQKPYKNGECDISGNEYSFVFIDAKKNTVVFFFTQMRMEYKIVDMVPDAFDTDFTSYTLQDQKGRIEMKINSKKTKIEFIYPDTHIHLTVGNSTKLAAIQRNRPALGKH